MTEVSFHFNVPDKLRHACLLLRKAHQSGRPMGVVGPPAELQALDTALWEVSAPDFIPHCSSDAPAQVLAQTSIVLAPDCSAIEHSHMLLQLGSEVPAGFERFERLIEIVGLDAPDRQQARRRWRYYADRGYAMKRWDASAAAGSRRKA
ncbi:MAG: DNA polymerase III subunit chi [Ottowia sp.]|nr:DNA polymerase III subunit chi [Ottowia sp.]